MKLLLEADLNNPLYWQRSLDAAKGLKNKERVIKKYIEQLNNYKLIKDSEDILTDSIYYLGFDPEKNGFLYYMSNLDTKITEPVARLVRALIVNESIHDIHSSDYDWLYRNDLYTDKEPDVLTKIKCLTWATNPDLQRGASEQITPDDLIDDGNLMSSAEMQLRLSEISVIRDNTLRGSDYFNYILKQNVKPNNAENQKLVLLKLLATNKEALTKYCDQNNLNFEDIVQTVDHNPQPCLNAFNNAELKGFVGKPDFKNGLEVAKRFINIVFLKQDISSTTSTPKSRFDSIDLKQKVKPTPRSKEQQARQTQKLKAKLKDEKDGMTGAAILARKLKKSPNNLNTKDVRDHVAGLLAQDGLVSIKLNNIKLGGLDDTFEKLLRKRYKSVMGRAPIKLLNTALVNAVDKSIKLKEG